MPNEDMPNEGMGRRTTPEPPDVNNRIVLTAVGGFLAFVALIMAGTLFYLKSEAPSALKQRDERPFPQPALQRDPQADLKRFEAQQRAALSGYAWVDRQNGLVKIPIEEAMRVIAERGDHAYDPLDATPWASLDPRRVRP